MKKSGRIFWIMLLPLLLYACGASVESEVSDWEKNKARLENYAVLYPILKDTLAMDLAYAEKKLNAAMEIKDEEAKIKAIQQANALISDEDRSRGTFEIKFTAVTPIKVMIDFEKTSKQLERVTGQVERIDNDYFSEKTIYLLEQSNELIKNVKSFSQREFQSASLALKKIVAVTDEMNEVYGKLNTYYADYKKMKFDQDKQERLTQESIKSDNNISTTSKSSEETKAISIKCTKCGSVFHEKLVKCKSCGAHLK